MSKYNHHSLALTDSEEEEFKATGYGVKKIFMAMVRALKPPPVVKVDPQTVQNIEEAPIIQEEE